MNNTEAKKGKKIGIISLGCPKALVDTERILTKLRAEGYEFSTSYEDADAVLVNTCGFLDSAKRESLEAIAEAMENNGKVIVTGCLGASDPEKIRESFPNISAITGPQQYEEVVKAIHEVCPPLHDPFEDLVPPQGIKLTPRHYSYLKISEGCSNKCTFCIIPELRGPLVSRPIIQVLAEAERLVKSGVKELLVISQDTSAYGIDTQFKEYPWKNRVIRTKFIDLCRELGEMDAWVRLHYMYPYPHVDEVIELMVEGKVLPYLDIPFQHASPSVLKAMKRPGNQEKTLERILNWRKQCPDITVRSSFIVGFPGETDEDFEYLLEWLEEAKLNRVGCFKYENVDKAASKKFPDQIPEEIKQERWERLMELQQQISADLLQQKIGKTMPVIIDDMDDDGDYIGRTKGDAPEIDGIVYVKGKDLNIGDIVDVTIDDADEYDLYGKLG